MIVWSDHPYEIGHRADGVGNGVEDIDGVRHEQPFLVMREATYDEWEAEYLSDGGGMSAIRGFKNHHNHVWFYEVSVD